MPVEKRRVIDFLQVQWQMSVRLSCELIGMSLSSYSYESTKADDSELGGLLLQKALDPKREDRKSTISRG